MVDLCCFQCGLTIFPKNIYGCSMLESYEWRMRLRRLKKKCKSYFPLESREHYVWERLWSQWWSYIMGYYAIGTHANISSKNDGLHVVHAGVWRAKIPMCCVGARKIPYVGQNANAAIKSYHSILKSIINLAKEWFVGRCMDWLIYHLIGDHYWYKVQCKVFGYVRNRKHKGIVASAIVRASTI